MKENGNRAAKSSRQVSDTQTETPDKYMKENKENVNRAAKSPSQGF